MARKKITAPEPYRQKRKMHVRRLQDDTFTLEKNYQLTMNEAALNQLVAAMSYLKATVLRNDDPSDQTVREFKGMEQLMNELLFTYAEDEDNCLTVD